MPSIMEVTFGFLLVTIRPNQPFINQLDYWDFFYSASKILKLACYKTYCSSSAHLAIKNKKADYSELTLAAI